MRSGDGELRFARVRGKTSLETAFAVSPLRFLTPRNHGDAAWVFASSLGGGLVEGDDLRVRVRVDAGARALLGTQASTKVYRSIRGASQRLEATVGDDALLVLLPDPVVCFEDARYVQHTDIDLAPRAELLLVESMTSGRAARGERWAFARHATRTRVTRGGRALVIDGVELDREHGDLRARMGRYDALATIIAFGDLARAIRAGSPAETAPPSPKHDAISSMFPVGDDGIVARVAAASVEAMTRTIRAWLAPLARALGDDPFARKW